MKEYDHIVSSREEGSSDIDHFHEYVDHVERKVLKYEIHKIREKGK